MGGLTVACLATAACAMAFAVLYIAQRIRIRRLAERLEDFLTRGGEALPFSVREDAMAPLANAAAELTGRLLLERQRRAEECRRTSGLTADISHQLKTPLASLRLFCELDGGDHLAEDTEQIDRMEKLIYSLLRLERLCADGYEFHFGWHQAEDVARSAWESVAPLFPACRMVLTGTARVRCDEKWLGEAFSNLMKNACQHMRGGGVVRVELEQTESSFFCALTDEGGGVEPRDLPRLFDRFYRPKGQEEGTGTGIGLAIVKEIIYRHHGSIYAENAEKGLRMRLTLPLLSLSRG